jgi:hypothetical protein
MVKYYGIMDLLLMQICSFWNTKILGLTQMLIGVSGATTSIYYARILMSNGVIST